MGWPRCAECRKRHATGWVMASDVPHLPADADGAVWLCTRCIQEPWKRIMQQARNERSGQGTLL